MPRVKRAAAIVATAALAVAGCGGGGGDEDAVKSTVESYISAFTAGDGAKACTLMTTATRQAFVQRVQLLTHTSDCGDALNKIRGSAGPAVMSALKKATVSDVKVSGQHATAKLTSGGHSSNAQLQKEGGSWKVSGVPGAGG